MQQTTMNDIECKRFKAALGRARRLLRIWASNADETSRKGFCVEDADAARYCKARDRVEHWARFCDGYPELAELDQLSFATNNQRSADIDRMRDEGRKACDARILASNRARLLASGW
jgi:crotonobetainyl-CoA:carnitine CoA-transferase CaiB-like acyl-CoA transferase